MRLLDYGIFFYLVNRLAGRTALAFTLLVTAALFLLVFGSLAVSITHTRTVPLRHAGNDPQRRAQELRRVQPAPPRDWQVVRREQLRQLGLDRQGKSQASR